MRLPIAKQLTEDLLKQHGLSDWKFGWVNTKRTYGRCNYRTQTIELSRPLTLLNTEPRTLLVILHEIAHALEPGALHSQRWIDRCKAIGGDGERFYSVVNTTTVPTRRYSATCSRCKHTYYFKTAASMRRAIGCPCSGDRWNTPLIDSKKLPIVSAYEPIQFNRAKGGTLELNIHESLTQTLEQVDGWSEDQLNEFLESVEQPVGAGHSVADLRLIAKSHAQVAWYTETKGNIPMAVKKNHEARSKKIEAPAEEPVKKGKKAAAEKKEGKSPAGRKPRIDTSKYSLVKDHPQFDELTAKARGQKKAVLGVIGRRKSWSVPDLVEAVEKEGLETKGAGGLLASVRHQLSVLVEEGLVVADGAPAAE